MVQRSALWLLPDVGDEARLRPVLTRIAGRLGRSPFPPHLTLFGKLEVPSPRLVESLERLAPEVPPFELVVEGVHATPSTFRALVLLLRPTQELLRLRRRLILSLPGCPSLPTPHLSLTYGALPIAAEEVLTGLALPERIRFDAIGLATPGPHGWADVGGWSLLHRAELGTNR